MRNNLRDQIPALKNKYYFNYGGQGPLPKTSLEAITNSWRTIQELGPFANDVWPFISNEIKETKSLLSLDINDNSQLDLFIQTKKRKIIQRSHNQKLIFQGLYVLKPL